MFFSVIVLFKRQRRLFLLAAYCYNWNCWPTVFIDKNVDKIKTLKRVILTYLFKKNKNNVKNVFTSSELGLRSPTNAVTRPAQNEWCWYLYISTWFWHANRKLLAVSQNVTRRKETHVVICRKFHRPIHVNRLARYFRQSYTAKCCSFSDKKQVLSDFHHHHHIHIIIYLPKVSSNNE